MDQVKSDLLDFIESKGGEISINMRQRKTFLRHFNYYDLDIPSLTPTDLQQVEKQRHQHLQKLKAQKKKETPKREKQTLKAVDRDDFLPMILAAKNQILTFSVRNSHTVSLARYFAMIFMNEDTQLNRIVALSYFCAKSTEKIDEAALGDLVCAGFLAHIGETQLPPSLNQRGILKLSKNERKSLQQHPGLSIHLIKKSQVEISRRSLMIIEQHHEKLEGYNFSGEIVSSHTEQLALILGACAHFFEYSSGQITGSPMKVSRIIQNLKDQNTPPGLLLDFGDTMIECLVRNIENHSANKAA